MASSGCWLHQVLESPISIEHCEWLEFENNADRGFCNEKAFSAT